MKDILKGFMAKIEESLEDRIEDFFETAHPFAKTPLVTRKRRDLIMSPRRHVVVATALAILALCMLFVMILAQIIVMQIVSNELVTGFLVVLSWIGATYFARGGRES